MKPIWFPEQNTIMGRDQLEYKALPAFRGKLPHERMPGNADEVIACYQLSDAEIEVIKESKVIWVRQMTGNGPLQPQLVQVEKPYFGPVTK
jgi:hypothetical protein